MIAGTSSGCGKTTLTCALLRLLQNRGKSPVSFKCGPDFIDPMFHEQVLGIPSTNLDSFFADEEEVRSILAEKFSSQGRNGRMEPADCAIIEGVMGLFDGLAGKSIKASSYDIARITKTPILLCIDASGMSRSILPLVKGFLDYDKAQSADGKNLIRCIFLNRISKASFQLLKSLIEEECAGYGVKVAGFLLIMPELSWESRHLGLFLPGEIQNLNEQIEESARLLSENLDFSMIEEMMKSQGSFSSSLCPASKKSSFTIALARDEAFCFYYDENLRLLEEAGARLIFFSPLHDKALPPDVDGILLGGGYPELYGQALQANESMRSSIKSALINGVSVMAECGGFMYLQEKLTNKEGKSYEMCGAIKGECTYTGKLVRFGYAEFKAKDVFAPGVDFSIKGHEFHYFDSTNNGSDFTATKPLSSRSWDCMIFTPKMLAGFPHLYYRSNPEIVKWFVESCRKK